MEAYQQFATVYDRLMEDMPYPQWLQFAQDCWERLGMPKTIADLGAGTGSIAIPLAQKGHEVYAIDLAADMLTIGRAKWESQPQRALRAEGGSLHWLEQDMREWELPKQVDAVISFCDCLNYLTEPEDVVETFQATWEGLAPGGTFLFDVHAKRQLERYAAEQPFVFDEQDVAYIWVSDYDEEREEIEHHLTIFAREGQHGGAKYTRFEEVHVQRAYDPRWLEAQLRKAGFSHIELYADFTFDAPNPQSERLFFVCVK
ncbi:SAM-dependent methyltransferase [Paenibacillus phyllosphaerae]|uniref:SAM-dependent methyltransferase n=1 Tax=Paenibacillus phyllosphaerae TaxID=274593 RepID=A0A7W5FLC1_9BACL|nr:class I SAM-dependent methyltransferase [Paenibacillus phyllosphaerae]MBB3108943.1 SAM-dependent methyltransferase [Paenibacillus phyllosphaerae]